MVQPSQSKAVEELVASVRSNVDVIRDAMKAPATEDSHAIVSDLMLDVKTSQDKLQKKASELAESGQFGNTNEIFEAIDQVTQLEPEFEQWSKSLHPADSIGANIHVDAPAAEDDAEKKKKKKKKKKRESENFGESAGGWEAFPPPPASTAWPTDQPPQLSVVTDAAPAPAPPQQARVSQVSADSTAPAAGRITLGMTWEMIGPLLGDPGSSDEVRRERLAELMKEAIAAECSIRPDRIRINRIS